MKEVFLLIVIALQLGQCPVKTNATATASSRLTLQKRPETKPRLKFVFAPPSSDEPSSHFALLMRSDGSLETFNKGIRLFSPKAEVSERETQLLTVSTCLKKQDDGFYRLDIYLNSADTSYSTVVKTLAELKAVAEPVLTGDAIICIRLTEPLK